MVTNEQKITALEWGIEALELRLRDSANNPNPIIQLLRRDTKEKIIILRKMKTDLEANQNDINT